MNSTQETLNKSVQELGGHVRAMFTDPGSVPYFAFAGAVIASSIGLYLAGKRHEALFLSTWPPTILAAAILNRMSRGLTERILQ